MAPGVRVGERHALGRRIGPRQTDARLYPDPAPPVGLRDVGGDVLVLDGEHPVECLEDRDLRAVGLEDVGELHPDRPGPDDGEAPRGLRHIQRLVRGPHTLPVNREEGEAVRPRAGGHDDVGGLVERRRVRRLDLDPPAAGEAAVTGYVGDLVLPEQVRDAPVHLLRHLTAPLLRRGQIHGYLARRDPVLSGTPYLRDHPRRRQE